MTSSVEIRKMRSTPRRGLRILFLKNDTILENGIQLSVGFFISSMKRVGQALEVRMLIEDSFEKNENFWIVVCGDFNAEFEEVPLDAFREKLRTQGTKN